MPTEPIEDDMQTALTERQTLIETEARRLLQDVQETGAARVARRPTELTTRSARAMGGACRNGCATPLSQ